MQENLVPFRPLGERVLVYIYDDGMSTVDIGGGKRLITGLQDTNFDSIHDVTEGKHPGARARWALIIGINENTTDVELGDKVLLDTMKWRRGVFAGAGGRKVWDIPVKDILLVDEDGPEPDEMEKIVDYLAGFDNELETAGTDLKNWM